MSDEMGEDDEKLLMNDYVKRLNTMLRILEPTGFCRFVIRKGKIVERQTDTMWYNICILIVADACATYLLWFANVKEQYLSLVEYIAIAHFTIFSNLLLFNITFGDKNRGLNLIKKCIEIDILLGATETEFMRQISTTIFKLLILFIGVTQVAVVSYMYYIFNVSTAIHVVGSYYFFWLFFAYDDFWVFIYLYSFLTTRVRYLNVALLKISKMKMEYIPKQLLFNNIIWRDKYDDIVKFHERSDPKNFCIAYRMLFDQLRQIEDCYRFTLVLGVFTVVMGSIVTVQTFILYMKDSDPMVMRASVISSWSLASWFHLLVISSQSDMFYKQIGQTKLICAYVQLKPDTPENLFRLTKTIFDTLELRDTRVSLYGMVYFDTGFVLRIAASTFVYITVQLQLALPDLKEGVFVNNTTSTDTKIARHKQQAKHRIENLLFWKSVKKILITRNLLTPLLMTSKCIVATFHCRNSAY